MKIRVSGNFNRVRGLKSTAPVSIDDFEVRRESEACLPNLAASNEVMIPYAFSKDLSKVCITHHDSVDPLLDGAFFYQSQFRDAQRISIDNSSVLPYLVSPGLISKPVFIVSPGRVGSTLVSNAFNRGGVACLSEPDAISSFKMKNWKSGSKDVRRNIEILLFSCVSLYGSIGDVIKLRSYSAPLVPLLCQVFPEAKFIFLFRSVRPWASSMLRTFNYNSQDLSWVLSENIKAYSYARESACETMVVSYEKFVKNSREVLSEVSCFLKEVTFDVDLAASALEHDSQKGSGIDRDVVDVKKVSKKELEDFLCIFDEKIYGHAKNLEVDRYLYDGE